MTNDPAHVLRLADLPKRKGIHFDVTPDAAQLEALARELGTRSLKRVRLAGALTPRGKADWHLTADLGATAVQDCVVTLAPVTTRIDTAVERVFIADWHDPEGAEVEMPDDTSAEPMPVTLDLIELLTEELAIALPDFPRAEGAALGEAVFAEPGVAPMTDEQAKPFAGLAGLKAKLGDDDS